LIYWLGAAHCMKLVNPKTYGINAKCIVEQAYIIGFTAAQSLTQSIQRQSIRSWGKIGSLRNSMTGVSRAHCRAMYTSAVSPGTILGVSGQRYNPKGFDGRGTRWGVVFLFAAQISLCTSIRSVMMTAAQMMTRTASNFLW
jgi:hypothetical protein